MDGQKYYGWVDARMDGFNARNKARMAVKSSLNHHVNDQILTSGISLWHSSSTLEVSL